LDSFRSKEVEEWLGGYRVVVPKKWLWAFSPDDAIEQVDESARAVGVPPGDPIWVFSNAWVEESLASPLSNQRDRDTKEFG